MKPATQSEPVHIPSRDIVLAGDLRIPPAAGGIVLFAHGSGSSRHSPRNRRVAAALEHAGLATLLFDLLTEDEDVVPGARFEIDLLGRRLLSAREWLSGRRDLASLAVGYFGASTGAAAALCAAALAPGAVQAIVSRGGRPDLAGDALALVRAPTLLIVGGEDRQVLALNRQALARLDCPKSLAVVPGATHLFEEPGALDHVATLAAEWFGDHLAGSPARTGSRRFPRGGAHDLP